MMGVHPTHKDNEVSYALLDLRLVAKHQAHSLVITGPVLK